MLKPLLIAATLLLVSCTPDAPRVANRTLAERAARAEEKLAVPPVPRTYPVGKNELIVVEVPVREGTGFVNTQTCFVWRDEAMKTASLSCGVSQPEVLLAEQN